MEKLKTEINYNKKDIQEFTNKIIDLVNKIQPNYLITWTSIEEVLKNF